MAEENLATNVNFPHHLQEEENNWHESRLPYVGASSASILIAAGPQSASDEDTMQYIRLTSQQVNESDPLSVQMIFERARREKKILWRAEMESRTGESTKQHGKQ